MPEAMHKELAKRAKTKGLTGDAKGAYIFGTLDKFDKQHGKGKKKKGKNPFAKKSKGLHPPMKGDDEEAEGE